MALMILEVRYYMSPVLIVILGVVFIILAILGIVFRKQLKAAIVAGQGGLFGERIAARTGAAPMGYLVAALGAWIAMGGLLIAFGIVGIVTNAHVYPQP